MRTVRRMFYREIGASVAFVAVAFLSLSYFIDFVDELQRVGRRGYTAWQAAITALTELPGNLYELMPFAVLIGTIYALARMAQASEFTILRTGGLSPGRALGLLAGAGLFFSALNFALGDVVVPATERASELLKTRLRGGRDLGPIGAWLRENRAAEADGRSFMVNVGGIDGNGALRSVHIYEFDARGNQLGRIDAARGRVDAERVWTLDDATVTRWPAGHDSGPDRVERTTHAELRWPSTLSAGVVSAAVLPLKIMSTVELWRYARHLAAHEQAAARYQLQFWKKALYPMACLVMVALALPFAYLHARGGGVSLKVFGGIMLGISFVLLNNLSGHVGLLEGWPPWLAAAAPGTLFLLLSMAAFAWLVRYR
jgi:lipopolysaccharide export system permease protein